MRIYVDTDFILALAKKDDWLKPKAEKVYKDHRNNIETSIATVIEVALVCKKRGMDPENFLGSLFEIADVVGMSVEEGLEVAHLIKNEGVGVFDSFHAALSRGHPIASSEKVYDRIGKERVRLEA